MKNCNYHRNRPAVTREYNAQKDRYEWHCVECAREAIDKGQYANINRIRAKQLSSGNFCGVSDSIIVDGPVVICQMAKV